MAASTSPLGHRAPRDRSHTGPAECLDTHRILRPLARRRRERKRLSQPQRRGQDRKDPHAPHVPAGKRGFPWQRVAFRPAPRRVRSLSGPNRRRHPRELGVPRRLARSHRPRGRRCPAHRSRVPADAAHGKRPAPRQGFRNGSQAPVFARTDPRAGGDVPNPHRRHGGPLGRRRRHHREDPRLLPGPAATPVSFGGVARMAPPPPALQSERLQSPSAIWPTRPLPRRRSRCLPRRS